MQEYSSALDLWYVKAPMSVPRFRFGAVWVNGQARCSLLLLLLVNVQQWPYWWRENERFCSEEPPVGMQSTLGALQTVKFDTCIGPEPSFWQVLAFGGATTSLCNADGSVCTDRPVSAAEGFFDSDNPDLFIYTQTS